jgi:hypothetical protein
MPNRKPLAAPILSLVALSIIGRMTAAKVPSIGPIMNTLKPRPIAHQAILVLGYSLNLLTTAADMNTRPVNDDG